MTVEDESRASYEKEMESTLSKIEAASVALAKIEFPSLQRPAVDHHSRATRPLLNWAIQMYGFSMLAHFREMLGSFLLLARKGQLPAAFVVCRCLFEMGAHSYYTHKHVRETLSANDLEGAWSFLHQINMGSRYMREEYGIEETEGPVFTAPREIGKVISCFNELTKSTQASTEYSFLSEFAHPNMAAFSHYYEMKSEPSGFARVDFVGPPRNRLQAPLPQASLAVAVVLDFISKLLDLTNEAQVSSGVKAILGTLAS